MPESGSWRVVISAKAERRIVAHLDYYRPLSAKYVAEVEVELGKLIARLASNPHYHPPDLLAQKPSANLRFVVIRDLRLTYRIAEKMVRIISARHVKQNPRRG